jgi:hypothetical protein
MMTNAGLRRNEGSDSLSRPSCFDQKAWFLLEARRLWRRGTSLCPGALDEPCFMLRGRAQRDGKLANAEVRS